MQQARGILLAVTERFFEFYALIVEKGSTTRAQSCQITKIALLLDSPYEDSPRGEVSSRLVLSVGSFINKQIYNSLLHCVSSGLTFSSVFFLKAALHVMIVVEQTACLQLLYFQRYSALATIRARAPHYVRPPLKMKLENKYVTHSGAQCAYKRGGTWPEVNYNSAKWRVCSNSRVSVRLYTTRAIDKWLSIHSKHTQGYEKVPEL